MLPINPRDLQRQLKQLKRMGLKVESLTNVDRVIIELRDKNLVLESPQVMIFEMAGQKMFYVVPSSIVEEPKEAIRIVEKEAPTPVYAQISEDDVRFVAEYTGVSIEEARRALEQAGGDIAKAIEILQQRTS